MLLKRVLYVLIVLILGILVTFDYVPVATSAERPGWQAEWNKAVEAAKKEGKVMIYSVPSGDVIRSIANAFEKRYGIKVEWVNGRGEELTQRIQTEKIAGIKSVDVIIAGNATSLVVMKPRGMLGNIGSVLILPEVVNPQAWISGHVPFYDKDQTGIAMIAAPQRYIVRNTAMVNDREITSYKDLLNPKWKGRITMNDPTVTGTCDAFMTMLAFDVWGINETKDFMRKLVKQEPAITRDRRLQAEWVARGKYALSIATNFENAIEFINLGSPIAFAKVKEGGKIGSGAAGLSVPETPAHTNASKVFVNWLLSKEGQTIFVKSYGSPGSRKDAPREGIAPQMFADPDEKFYEETEEWILFRSSIMKVSKEIFAPLLK